MPQWLLEADWHLILDRDGDHRSFDLSQDPGERYNCYN